MLAFYVGKKPHLYAVKPSGHGIASSAEEHYASEGIGKFLADYLLREYAAPKTHSDIAIATSIFAIKKVKDTTKYCGGNTTIKRIVPLYQFIDLEKQYIGKSEIIPQEYVNLAEKRLVDSDEKIKKTRNKRTYDILKKTGRELWAKHLKRVRAELKAEEEQEAKWKAAAPGFTMWRECSQCKHGFQAENAHFTADRKGISCPKCGQIDPV
jgi:hypothetical protein